MTEQQTESITFDDQKMIIRRENTGDLYIALQPPDAIPYMVAPLSAKPEELVAFVEHWQDTIRELRIDMIKRFEKSRSPKCHYQTGDVAYLFGRPFMLRVFPATSKKRTRNTRVRGNVSATVRSEVSVIDLFLINVNNYDQARSAFLSFAKKIFAQNVTQLVKQCMDRTFPGEHIPQGVQTRPMRDEWVSIDDKKDTVWFSERLIPYPPDCVVYAFLVEFIKLRHAEATEDEVYALLEKGIPRWQHFKEILTDPNSRYTNQ